MKAKRISAGEEVEVTELTFTNMKTGVVCRRDIKNGGFIAESELEFLPDTPGGVTIEGWICRDGCEEIKNSILRLFLKGEPFPDCKPERVGMNSIQMWKGANGLHLPSEMFPEVTWQSEPKRVKITITPME